MSLLTPKLVFTGKLKLLDRVKKNNSHAWSRYATKIMRKKKWPVIIIYLFSDDFGSRNPVIQKTFQTKIQVYLYRSTRANVRS